MKSIKICIGSACHLKGSYQVLETFKVLIKEYKLEEQLEILPSFCQNNCTKAVSVTRWDGKVFSVSQENIRQTFRDEIIAYL
ncbi:MAG: (2Fe-2S) ferredoxin domain-containing protein [Cellulosilyticaceae bacterium]